MKRGDVIRNEPEEFLMVELEPGYGYITTTCRTCGQPRLAEAIDVSALKSTFSTVAGRDLRCPTPRCGEVCKICRREPGDVHGPDCGPLMFGKVERPHIVDRSDCT